MDERMERYLVTIPLGFVKEQVIHFGHVLVWWHGIASAHQDGLLPT